MGSFYVTLLRGGTTISTMGLKKNERPTLSEQGEVRSSNHVCVGGSGDHAKGGGDTGSSPKHLWNRKNPKRRIACGKILLRGDVKKE